MNRVSHFLCMLLFVFAAGCGYTKQGQIDSYVASEKANLPKTLFADVRVLDMESKDSEIVYYCNSKGLSNARVEAAEKQLKLKAENFIRKNKSALKRIIDNEIKMTFVGQNDAKEEIFRFTVNPWQL